MNAPWTAERIGALAPDPASLTAGRKLSNATSWSGTGMDPDRSVVWGACKGSGKNPYLAAVDLSEPAYKCSCPSRKIPCKHILALLLLWSAGGVETTQATGFAGEWMDGRAERAEKAAQRAARPAGPQSKAAAAAADRRSAERDRRITDGLEDLDQWLRDLVRTGLSTLEGGKGKVFTDIAARMVDAQAPGVAKELRRLPDVLASGEGWHERLLEELASLRLLVTAHRRLAELPAPLAASVRAAVGYPTTREEVLGEPAVRDRWHVAALQDTKEDKLAVRRVWLCGATTRRVALVVTFSGVRQAPDASLLPGSTVDAEVHFYPGAVPVRAMVGTVHDRDDVGGDLTIGALQDLTGPGAAEAASDVPGTTDPKPIEAALDTLADAFGADPWTRSVPMLLRGIVPVHTGRVWHVGDGSGVGLPWDGEARSALRMLAVTGGVPSLLLADVSPTGARPLAVVTDQGATAL